MSERHEGVRAVIRVGRDACPLPSVCGDGEARLLSKAETDDAVVEDILVPDGACQHGDEVFAYGSSSVRRVERHEPCVCDTVESLGVPVSKSRLDDEAVYLTVHAPAGELQDLLREVGVEFGGVRLEDVDRDHGDAERHQTVDIGALTDRQREALETAYEMGYFEADGGANATEVADEMDVSLSTFTEHIARAESKVMSSLLS